MYDHKVLPDMTGMRPDSTISLVRFDPVKEMDVLRVSFGTRCSLHLRTRRLVYGARRTVGST